MCRRRPCRFCRRWFSPDVRVGERQRACSVPVCQERRRAATQASWRGRNRDYAAAWRIQRRREQERPEPPRPLPPLDRLPWDIAQDEFKPAGAAFVAVLGRVLVTHAKDQIVAQVRVRTKESCRHAHRAPEDSRRHGGSAPKDPRPPVVDVSPSACASSVKLPGLSYRDEYARAPPPLARTDP